MKSPFFFPNSHFIFSRLQHSAKAEERRIQAEREEKEARLKRFQDDVKKRVAELARIKRKHELEKSYQAVSNIVRHLA